MTRIISRSPLNTGKNILLVGIERMPSLYIDIAMYRPETDQQTHLPDDSHAFAQHSPITFRLSEAEALKRQKQLRREHLEFLTHQAQELNMGYE